MKNFPKNSVDFAVMALSLSCHSPTQDSKKHMLTKYLLSVCNLFLTSLVLLDLIETGFSQNVTKFVGQCEWFGLILQVLSDQILLSVLCRKSLKDLLIKRKHFRKEVLATSKDTKLPWNLNTFLLLLYLYALLFIIAILYSVVLSAYSHELLVSMWHPMKYSWMYNFLLYVQWIWVIFLGVSEYASICFFNALCQEVAVQFKLLNRMAEEVFKEHINMKTKVISFELKEVIRYHRFLINYTHDLKNALPLRLLVVVAIIGLVICTELYIISSESTTIGQVCRCVLFLSLVVLQLMLICYLTHEITAEASNMANVAYNSEWYLNNSLHLKFFVRMLIMRGNKELSLTAGNMVIMRRGVITKIFRTALSYYTFLKSMEK